jgi:hypothetical protein
MKLIRVSSELEPWLVRDLNRRTSLRRVEISLRILISSSEFEIWVRARLDRGRLAGRAACPFVRGRRHADARGKTIAVDYHLIK